jgi:hypothetical protein
MQNIFPALLIGRRLLGECERRAVKNRASERGRRPATERPATEQCDPDL